MDVAARTAEQHRGLGWSVVQTNAARKVAAYTYAKNARIYIYISYTYSHMYLDTYIHVCYCMHAFCVRTPQTLCIHGRIKFICTISSSTSVIIALECKLHLGLDIHRYIAPIWLRFGWLFDPVY